MLEVVGKYNAFSCYTNGHAPKRGDIGHGGAGICFYGWGLRPEYRPAAPPKKIIVKAEGDAEDENEKDAGDEEVGEEDDEMAEDLKDFIEPIKSEEEKKADPGPSKKPKPAEAETFLFALSLNLGFSSSTYAKYVGQLLGQVFAVLLGLKSNCTIKSELRSANLLYLDKDLYLRPNDSMLS